MTAIQHWTATSLQVVNWGGFAGPHTVPFSPTTTALTGVSGAGKSTLMDAYIALMMDSNTPFNSASNDNTTGGARSDTQRNILSYMRGKTDSGRDGGALTAQVLRGDGETTWSAVAMTWTDGSEHFTAMRIYYAKPSAKKFGDVQSHFATTPSAFNLADLEAFAPAEFEHRMIRGAHPSVQFNGGPSEFANHVQTRLGIGDPSHSDVGAKALKLLARVQQGGQVSRVNTLYTETVLETPNTFMYADRALNHFRDMQVTYQTMKTAEEKIAALEGMEPAHTALIEAQDEAFGISSLRISKFDLDTPWGRWSAEKELTSLDIAIDSNRAVRTQLESVLTTSHESVRGLETQEENLQSLIAANGGTALQLHQRNVSDAKEALRRTDREVGIQTAKTSLVQANLSSEAGLADAKIAAADFLAEVGEHTSTLEAAYLDRNAEGTRLTDQLNRNKNELTSLRDRTSLIEKRFHDARTRLAHVLGLTADEMPFIAELIDVAPTFNPWRRAANLALGGWGMHLLVDETRLEEFKRAINHLDIKPRVKFKGVAIGVYSSEDPDTSTLPGRLLVKEDSPFHGWVTAALRAQFDYTCVDDVNDLWKHKKSLTLQGQTNDGRTGAHGDSGLRPVLGFSNKTLIDTLEEENSLLAEQIVLLVKASTKNRNQKAALEKEETAHLDVQAISWADIDLASATQSLEDATNRLNDFTANNDTLAGLQDELKNVKVELAEANKGLGVHESDLRQANKLHAKIVEREDDRRDFLERLDRDDAAHLTDAQRALIDQDPFAHDLHDYAAVTGQLARLAGNLSNRFLSAEKAVTGRSAELRRIFRGYLNRWDDPNLSDHPTEAYASFKNHYDHLFGTGLHETRRKFTEHVNSWAADDLVSLNAAYSSAHNTIRDRLDEVNEVLTALPFGPDADRLKITRREHHHSEVDDFRRDLQTLASHSTTQIDEKQIEARWEQISAFMIRLDPETRGGGRDRVLDVRRHVHIEAEKIAEDGTSKAVYDTLGDKSGGETQELVAFIIGAALRYQLGDTGLDRPRYRPVFLDEGFIKADSEFAGRSVQAWLGLGFQLIIGAPLDKITGLEPHVESLLAVLKRDNVSHVTAVVSAEQAHHALELAER